MVTEAEIKRERQKARELRKSRWWQSKIQKCNCYHCGKDLDASTVTMDHLLPIAKGGKSTKTNVVTACKECNTKRHSTTVFDLL
jgi:5-methylcytosine-specific restriction enzyme A